MKRAIVTVLLGAMMVLAPGVGAETPADVERFEGLVTQGKQAYERGDFEESLEAFEEAETIFSHPQIGVRIVSAMAQLNRCDAAWTRLERLREESSAELDARLDELEASLDECVSMGTLVVECSPATASLEVDGQAQRCGEAIEVEAGSHQVVAQAEGFETRTDTVAVREADTSTHQLALERAEVEEPEVEEPEVVESAFPYRAVGLGAAGTGLALIGAGVWIDSGSAERQRDIKRLSANGQFDRADQLEEEAVSRRRLTYGLLAGGAVLVAAGGGAFTLGTWSAESSDSAESAQLSVSARPDGVEVRVQW